MEKQEIRSQMAESFIVENCFLTNSIPKICLKLHKNLTDNLQKNEFEKN